jgi:hypothetical protein
VKHASLILPFISVAAILVACATSDDEITEGKAPTDPAPTADTAKLPPASDTPPAAPAAKQCVSSCTTDADCQNSCASVSNGIQCCDQNTKKCFATSQAQCPMPEADAGTEPPAY